MAKTKKDPAIIVAEAIRRNNAIVRDNVFTEAVEVFGKDFLFINDCIKQIMQEHFLNYQDANLQAAFVRVAMGVKKNNYPTKLKKSHNLT